MRSTLVMLTIVFAAACVQPANAERRVAAGISAERDVAAAIGTWTVRAYHPVVADTSLRASLSMLPALQAGQAPVRVVNSGDEGSVTLIGPYRNPITGQDEITRLETRLVNGRMVGAYYTRALKSGLVSRGSFEPMPSMVIAAN